MMSITVKYYGILKDRFNLKDVIIDYGELVNNKVYDLITKCMEFNNINFSDIVELLGSQVVIIKNENRISIRNVYFEKVNDGDIIKIYLALSGG